ncbi:MAG: PA2169 family four-helix-bundle protein [Flavobacteriales bacterium]|nr:PA2169 family four-helix-bundle protein [Flavobacteriales bacterium]
MDIKEQVNKLQSIHDLIVDSKKGYQEASNRAEDIRVKALLETMALHRVPLEADLDAGLQTLEPGRAHHDGTIKGDLHRAWIDVRDALSTSDNANVLKECERGEKYLLEQYDDVLSDADLAMSLREPLMKQRAEVQSDLNRVIDLRKTFEAVEE